MGAALLVPFWLATLSADGLRRDADDLATALALFNVWAVCLAVRTLAGAFAPPEVAERVVAYAYPPIDLAFGVFMTWLHRRRPEPWKVVIIMITGLQFSAHVLYAYLDAQPGPLPYSVRYGYPATLNATFALMVVANSWPGGSWVVARMGRRMRRGFPLGRARVNGRGG